MTLSVSLRHGFPGLDLDVDFQTPPGLTVLFGRSGAGKSSIVQAVAGLLRAKEGRISVQDRVLFDSAQGVNLPPHRRHLGYVFQDARLFPHLSVRQNLTYGRRFAGRRAAPDFGEVVALLGLSALLTRRPAALSGGEKQRVAIGRALLAAPALLLADEPLAALDETRKAEILPYFENLRDAGRVPILYVSHSPSEVARLATTVIALEQGRILRQGPAAQVLADPEVLPMGVRAAGAVITARVVAHHADGLSELDAGGARLFLPDVGRPTGAELRLRIPAQEVILSLSWPQGLSALNILPARVEQIREGAGPGTVVSLSTAAGMLLARVTRRSVAAMGLAPGVACHAVLKSLAIAREDAGGGG